MRRKVKRRIRSKLRIITGVPLAVGTLAFVGGKLPGSAGTIVTSAIAPSVGMTGAVVKVGTLGIGLDIMRESFKVPVIKRRKRRRL